MLSADYLHSVLDYDPDTGGFRWRIRGDVPAGWNNRYAGTTAGRSVNGYVYICIRYRKHAAHRLAWLYVHGALPGGPIDHINRDRADNRIANLREATATQNQGNRSVASSNLSGTKGVTFDL